jgi:hypothetical protein
MACYRDSFTLTYVYIFDHKTQNDEVCFAQGCELLDLSVQLIMYVTFMYGNLL